MRNDEKDENSDYDKTDVEKRKREREKWFKGNNEQCLISTMNLWVLKVSNWYHEFQINWRIQIGGKVFVSLVVYIIGYIAYTEIMGSSR